MAPTVWVRFAEFPSPCHRDLQLVPQPTYCIVRKSPRTMRARLSTPLARHAWMQQLNASLADLRAPRAGNESQRSSISDTPPDPASAQCVGAGPSVRSYCIARRSPPTTHARSSVSAFELRGQSAMIHLISRGRVPYATTLQYKYEARRERPHTFGRGP